MQVTKGALISPNNAAKAFGAWTHWGGLTALPQTT